MLTPESKLRAGNFTNRVFFGVDDRAPLACVQNFKTTAMAWNDVRCANVCSCVRERVRESMRACVCAYIDR